jgi:hypothetical protein
MIAASGTTSDGAELWAAFNPGLAILFTFAGVLWLGELGAGR